MSGMLADAAQVGGVQRLAIVDDAYDPPAGGEITEDAFNRFVQGLEDNGAALTEIEAASALQPSDLDDWEHFTANTGLILELWLLSLGAANVAVGADLAAILATLFTDIHADRISKLQQLKPLEDLIGAMGVPLMKLGADPEPETVATADVVFLDLYLSGDVPPLPLAGGTPRSALEKARDRAIRYLEAVRSVTANDLDATSPAFILISSQGSTQIGQNFRKRAAQAASRFRFVSKQSIERNEPQGLLAIADILRTCRASAVIEPLRKSWPAVVADAQMWVADKLLELDISDFGRLYHLSLRQEGQPVEDYVKELVAGALAERVACAFSDHRPTPSAPSPFAETPGQYFEAPSNAFADLYSATRITRDAGYRGPSGDDPMSGDLYLDGTPPAKRSAALYGRTVLAVMSPICDLVSRNGKAPAAKSALLLQGTLQPTSFKHDGDPQTISFDGRFYEVEWAMKHPQALTLAALKSQVKKKERTWLGRLKAEHFIALQSDYLTSFGRVGLLKPPGVFETLAGKVCVRENGQLITLGKPFDAKGRYAYLSPDPSKPHAKQPIFFTGEFLGALADLLAEVRDSGDREAVTRGRATGILERMDKVIEFVTRQAASQHRINDYLRVDLLEGKGDEIPASADGLLVIAVWKL